MVMRNVKVYKNALEYNVYYRCLCYFLNQATMAKEQEFMQLLLLLLSLLLWKEGSLQFSTNMPFVEVLDGCLG